MNSIHVFEQVQCKSRHTLAGVQNWPWLFTSWPKINRVKPSFTYSYRSSCPLLKFSFPKIFCSLLRYWLAICHWYMNLPWYNTDQVRLSSRLTYLYTFLWNLVHVYWFVFKCGFWLLSRLTYFHFSYCPLQKFCFPKYYLHEFVPTVYRSSFTFGPLLFVFVALCFLKICWGRKGTFIALAILSECLLIFHWYRGFILSLDRVGSLPF